MSTPIDPPPGVSALAGEIPQVPAGSYLRFETVVQIMIRMRKRLYPWMKIKNRADGTLEVIVSRPPGASS